MIENGNRLLDELGMKNRYATYREYGADLSMQQEQPYRLMSGGVQIYYWMLHILSQIPENSVLLMDDPFAKMDRDSVGQFLEIMKKMRDIQFILTAQSNMYMDEGWTQGCSQICLDTHRDFERLYKRPDFVYKRLFHDRSLNMSWAKRSMRWKSGMWSLKK